MVPENYLAGQDKVSPSNNINRRRNTRSTNSQSSTKLAPPEPAGNMKTPLIPTKHQKKTCDDKVKKKYRTAQTVNPVALKSLAESPPIREPPKPSVAPETRPQRGLRVQSPVRYYTDDDSDGIAVPTLREEDGPKRFVVGVDYGTTFTSVSYYSHPVDDDHPRAFPGDVKVIMNWPNDVMGGVRRQVPTESWYSSVPKQRPTIDDQFDSEEEDDEQDGPSTPGSKTAANFSTGDSDAELDGEESDKYLWGYDVPYQKFKANTTRDEFRHIARPKLMLVNSTHTRDDREHLRPRINSLIEAGLIRKFKHKKNEDPRDVQDVITDFLVEIFKHTKRQLMDHEGYTQDCPVSFVLTVPAIWSSSASRVLQYAVEAAIRSSGFGTLNHGSVDNLFIINEPEAAATYLLGNSHDMLAGETFVVLDCGGGTVDCVTYTVTNGYPLRLKAEVGKPTGDNCGASYLNENFEKHLLKRLADETYLDRHGETRESIVRHLVPDFEDYDKRNKDIAGRPRNKVRIIGLIGDLERDLTGSKAKRFENNRLVLDVQDYKEIFLPLLRRVSNVLRGQLEMAMSKRKDVKKIFLIGGFGACPSLRSYLKTFLKDFEEELKLSHEIRLVTTTDQESVTAVSSGAVLRALNKEGGPERVANCSYGFLRIQPYEPERVEGHEDAQPVFDEFDEQPYVAAIDYFMLKGDMVAPVHRYKPIPSVHAFAIDGEKLLCEEILYVSDLPTKSDFPLDHAHNKDAQVAGRIITDFTFLRDEKKILPILPIMLKDGEARGKPHYEIKYDLVVIVEGRNLRYEARYPSGIGGRTQKMAQISIAAAFLPGTS